ncbi:MAG: UDP-N-acetylmuramoylalanyl-D-glutamyl-2,6-diaminopimelate--D-alanyl-D-alanyl ligase [Candidatus Adlerbacteria bacterium]|nr:UDP-N-acetylmuramoylalanyl-D-glutamyl-2,6-diaminopimelate--D-alanyl-D-alanyl ligase [Candidatus Adlerbacteria bacterium]
MVLRKYKPKIIAVTGSVGKTSTKDAVFALMSRSGFVRKSEKSFNSELGLPLTILGIPNGWNNPLRWIENLFDGLMLIMFTSRYPDWLVLEVGADRPGDIKSLASWLEVDIAVITRLPEVPVHVEYFESPEAVAEEKAALIDTLKPSGTLVVYADDDRVHSLAAKAHKRGAEVVTFGIFSHSDVRADDFKLVFEEGKEQWPIGMSARLTMGGTSAPLSMLGAIGAHMLLSALAAAAVGQALKRDIIDVLQALQTYVPPPGRMHLIRGMKSTFIIDDSYNSSPAAATAALDTFIFIASRPNPYSQGRKIAVFGDMLELGRHSVEEHRKVGAHAAHTVDLLVTVGFRARDIAQGALDAGFPDAQILQYEDSNMAAEELKNLIQEGDCILVKGSQSTRMERVVEGLMVDPERAHLLLVRQDEEWKKR